MLHLIIRAVLARPVPARALARGPAAFACEVWATWVPEDNGAGPIPPAVREELDCRHWNLDRSGTLHTDLRLRPQGGMAP